MVNNNLRTSENDKILKFEIKIQIIQSLMFDTILNRDV